MSAGLSPEDFERLKTLFAQAADLPPEEQRAFVERECGSNAALRDELEGALGGLSGADVLGRIQGAELTRAGTRIGSYELLHKIGAGGMGEVYAAEQLAPVRRRVALKLIKPGMDSAAVVARFEAERQALARMAHAHVAQVFDGGTTEDGLPYFVMELVDGEPITDYCDRHSVSTRERLELFLGICEGVQHAHQKGVIHRDLKPSNLLVAAENGRAVPKIIDFGVARATTGRLAERTLHTMVGQVVGTLDYMSPEQADPSDTDLDTRSDVYSLGVVLYQLISGMLPFDLASAGVPVSVMQRTIREKDPPTPSTRLRRQTGTAAAIAPLHGTSERALIRQLSGDLDWICLKALEKDRTRRYQSPAELAADLRRHLADEPVLAGRPGLAYRTRKFVRRNRVGVTAAVLVTGSGLAGLAGLASARLEGLAGERLQAAFGPLLAHRALPLLKQRADEDLWPPVPERIPAMEAWSGEAEGQWERRDEWVRLLDELRSRADPGGPAVEAAETWAFESSTDRVQHDVLVELLEELEAFHRDLLEPEGITEEHGWSVPKRLEFARGLEAGHARGGEHDRAWNEALPLIRADYPGLELGAQVGLVPIGKDPASGLWEFADLATGEPAVRDAERRLILTEATGLVLVLIPAGDFWMGAQHEDPDGQNYDPFSRFARSGDPEGPPVLVRVPAFFLSKYEMTRSQWKRIAGVDPSPANRPDMMGPVVMVDWNDCERLTARLGLCLPSEQQWEYAARAGTDTVWSTGGVEESALDGYANVFDQGAKEARPNWLQAGTAAPFHDGTLTVTRVGSYLPNRWGLHDVHGNVWEWCENSPYRYVGQGPQQAAPGVPNSDPDSGYTGEITDRVTRGGSAREGVQFARSACRVNVPSGYAGHAHGLRPARRIDP